MTITMAHFPKKPGIFRWTTSRPKAPVSNVNKVQLNENEIKQWVKRVERASEFAVSEVFSMKKPQSGKKNVPLQSIDQLQDHDDAYSEARSILSEWMNQKLRLELEMDDGEETGSCEMDDVEAKQLDATQSSYNNFDELYFHLEQEEENTVVHSFLQDLMDTEVMDSGTLGHLSGEIKRWRDPSITMEVRHKQVKENRIRREAEREKLRKEKKLLREAREEARLLEEEEQRKRRQEARQQEQVIQEEMIRLRREMEEKRSMEQLARNMERERLQKQRSSKSSASPRHHESSPDKELRPKLKNLEEKVQLLNLQSMQRHFSTWYSVILDGRVRMGKAAAVCDWRRQLRAWRAWRALVWAQKEDKETEKIEEELRHHHRRCQQALESDRRRLLRRCFSDWRVWCRVELHRKELLQQQEETRCKMAALIHVATSGKSLRNSEPPETQRRHTESIFPQEIPAAPESSPSTAKTTSHSQAPPTQAWQVTRRHATLSLSELQQASQGQRLQQQDSRRGSADLGNGQFKHRHAALQQTVAEQRKLLKEQQQQILLLQRRQNILELRHGAENTALTATAPPGVETTSCLGDTGEARGSAGRAKRASRENGSSNTEQKAPLYRAPLPHPAVQAMEERARQRSERRKEIEELRRQQQEEKLARMKAAEEERLKAEEEEKQREIEKKKEERRQQKLTFASRVCSATELTAFVLMYIQKELEKQKKVERDQELTRLASQHYLTTLLRHRGMSPWKRLLEQSHANTQRALDHSSWVLLRRCFCCWHRSVAEAQAEREARAGCLYHRILLQRALGTWKRLKDVCFVLEARADRFHRTNTQRRVLKALVDHLTEERIASWDKEQQAREHHHRKAVAKCFTGWRRLPVVLREEKQREARRDQLRRKVSEILPDFRASPVDSVWRPLT
ncbi:hypothetical protein DNTS_032915 [Danionella cerebrum]|uniref:Uncharacterized protein n=1 Tax=Danionella cerebrum TaxID=2873325 RepID=A0A553MTE4_9TELE|nr:hypothetical protein DNTS_032915 [Danionella translucida]